jgi:hypothetical protein
VPTSGFFLHFCVFALEGTCVTSEKNKFAAQNRKSKFAAQKPSAPGAAFLRQTFRVRGRRKKEKGKGERLELDWGKSSGQMLLFSKAVRMRRRRNV